MGLLAWSVSLRGERLWPVEDCCQLTRALEYDLLAAGTRRVGRRDGRAPRGARPSARVNRLRCYLPITNVAVSVEVSYFASPAGNVALKA
jgi:hypothetical protein